MIRADPSGTHFGNFDLPRNPSGFQADSKIQIRAESGAIPNWGGFNPVRIQADSGIRADSWRISVRNQGGLNQMVIYFRIFMHPVFTKSQQV